MKHKASEDITYSFELSCYNLHGSGVISDETFDFAKVVIEQVKQQIVEADELES